MQQTVAKLYANLIQFMVHAMHWYQKGRPRRALGAIFKPFALDFQDHLSEVNELSKSVDDIAVSAAQAELRAVHAKVEDAYSELTSVRREIKRLGDLVSLEASRVFHVASCMIHCHLSGLTVLIFCRHAINIITTTARSTVASFDD